MIMNNIDNLTFGEIKQLVSMFGNNESTHSQPSICSGMIGKKVIIRTYSAGVWFGELTQKSGTEVTLNNARRMWRWCAAESISLSAVSIHGINHGKSKICEPVDSQWLDAIEITPCTDKAIKSIEGAENVKAQ